MAPLGPPHRRPRAAAGLAVVLALSACSGTAPADPGSAAASATPSRWPSPGQNVSVLGLGDSVMESANCACAGPVSDYADLLQARTNASVDPVNLGSGGLTAADLSDELSTDPGLQDAVRGADVVLVTIGANDVAPLATNWQKCPASCWTSPLATLQKNLASVLAEVVKLRKNPHVPVLVSDYWNVVQDGSRATQSFGASRVQWSRQLTAATNSVIEAQARQAGATPVDLVTPFRGADGSKDPTTLLLDDGDHPSAEGVELIATSFIQATSF